MFRYITIGQNSYGQQVPENEIQETIPNVKFQDQNLMDNLHSSEVQFQLYAMALCHSVNYDPQGSLVCPSPDEIALVNAAKYFGMAFIERDQELMKLQIQNNEIIQFKVLDSIQFTPERARMTVIVGDPAQKIYVFTKGSDVSLDKRIIDSQSKRFGYQQANNYASLGLRTLIFAMKELQLQEFQQWHEQFAQQNQEGRERLAEQLENNLSFLGVTAVEDQLQDQVPYTLKEIQNADIKIWILTGDKIETTMAVALESKLFSNINPNIYYIIGQNPIQVRALLEETKNSLQNLTKPQENSLMVITGEALIYLNEQEKVELIKLGTEKVKCVLACRVSPIQKSELVKLCKSKLNKRTLAIGDGANDVAMITSANIGVAIIGQEGPQAVKASDIAISQFKFLRHLLFIHGRECYRRNSYVVLYGFYKNIVFVFPILYWGVWNAYSSQMFYNFWLYGLFNVFYASFPIFFYALFDRERPLTSKEYKITRGSRFGTFQYWSWVFYAASQAFVILWLSYACLWVLSDGVAVDQWILGAIVLVSVI